MSAANVGLRWDVLSNRARGFANWTQNICYWTLSTCQQAFESSKFDQIGGLFSKHGFAAAMMDTPTSMQVLARGPCPDLYRAEPSSRAFEPSLSSIQSYLCQAYISVVHTYI